MITTSVAEAAECLKAGQVLAYPTEAVWGLGCDPIITGISPDFNLKTAPD